MSKPQIGFCGLGAMGFGMATHLIKQGYPVTGYDVYQPTLDRFKSAGGTPATSLAESASDKPFYICMVANHTQAQSALFDDQNAIVPALPQGATLFLASTVAAAYAQSVEKQLKDAGRDDILFIDCPVSGGAVRAADGTLSIMAGASLSAIEKGQWLLEELSAPGKLFIVEGGIGAGSNMKMVHQVLAAIQILVTGEAMGFAARLGLDAKEVRERVVGGKAWGWMFENRSQRVISGEWEKPVSALTIILKDVGIITSQGRLQNFPTPLCSIAEQVYLSALMQGYGVLDDACMVRMYYPDQVAKVSSTLSEDEKSKRLRLVEALLVGIQLCAAAESISFAHHVGLPLDQLYTLAVDAAGGSTMFREEGRRMIDALNGADASSGGRALNDVTGDLKEAAEKAQEIKCPLFLGDGALNLLFQGIGSGGGNRTENLVELWKVEKSG